MKTSCGHVPCYDCAQTWFETFYFCRSYEEALYNQPEGITVVVVENNSMHFELSFRIKRTAQLKKLMDIVCDEGGVSPQTARLLYRGAQIDFNDTAEEVSQALIGFQMVLC